MKRFTMSIVALLIVFLSASAQTPQGFKYQAVARNDAGAILSNQNVSLRISILKREIAGEVVYSESHTAQTSAHGLINLEIGRGEVENGNFASISWGENTHFIKVEMDAQGGTNYSVLGTSQLMSVPYALYSEKSGDNYWHKLEDEYFLPEGNVGIGVSQNNSAKLMVGGYQSTYKGQILLVDKEYPISDSRSTGLITAFGSNMGDKATGRLWAIGSQSPLGKDLTITNDLEGAITFGVNGNYRAMSLSKEGYLGVGTTEPARKLHVADAMRLEPSNVAPNNPEKGDIYFGTDGKLHLFDGVNWNTVNMTVE